jgi:hypothetical protein
MRALVFLAVFFAACGSHVAPEPSAEPFEAPLPPAPPAILFGDILHLVDAKGAPVAEMLAIGLDSDETAERPAAEPIGRHVGPSGTWEIRPLEEVPLPAAEATLVDRGMTCPAHVVRAQRVHGVFEPAFDDVPALRRERAFLALTVESVHPSCRGVHGVINAEEVNGNAAFRPDMLPLASPALVALVEPYDRTQAGSLTDEATTPLRALVVGGGITIVFGHARWVVRGGQIVGERGGRPLAVVSFLGHVMIDFDSPSGDIWWSTYASLTPEPDPTVPCRAVLAPRRTPLRVYASVPADPATATYTEGSFHAGDALPVVRVRGDWIEVSAPAGWVRTASVRLECD